MSRNYYVLRVLGSIFLSLLPIHANAQQLIVEDTVVIREGRIFVGPDPNDPQEMFKLLQNGQIARELGVSDSELEAVSKICLDASRRRNELWIRSKQRESSKEQIRANLDERRQAERLIADEMTDAIEEILNPERIDRLRQLMYRVEVSKLGLTDAILFGRLGSDAVQIYEGQRERFGRVGHELEDELQRRILALRAETERKILDLLTAEQRSRVDSAVGNTFYFGEYTDDRAQLQRMLSDEKEKPVKR